MLELLNSLTLNAALAVVGSIGTITLGVFGYLLKIRRDQNKVDSPADDQHEELQQAEISKLHSRVSSARDDISSIQGEIKVFESLVRSLEKQIEDHERRDIADFKSINAKSDKTLDIVIQILQDDKL